MASNANLLTAKTQMTRAFTVMSFAVEGLSESLAQEVGPLGIRVVLISPSGFATDWAGNSAAETPCRTARSPTTPTLPARTAATSALMPARRLAIQSVPPSRLSTSPTTTHPRNGYRWETSRTTADSVRPGRSLLHVSALVQGCKIFI
jgi:NAD(P)-dependent dehydrogenase (short-subunit alcohol dehydrogenase family)